MKTPKLQFSTAHPDAPGLWLVLHPNNLISVTDVTEKDIEQDKREPSWLNGNWAGLLDRKSVLDWLDEAIRAEAKAKNESSVLVLQKFRVAFFTKELDASVAQSAELGTLNAPVAGSTPAGRTNDGIDPTDMACFVREKGFDDLVQFNELVATADISTPERFAAFNRWKLTDGSKTGLLNLPRQLPRP